MERFQKIYSQGIVSVMEIWVDTETGVHYLFHRDGNGAGFTPLLDREGKPVVRPSAPNPWEMGPREASRGTVSYVPTYK